MLSTSSVALKSVSQLCFSGIRSSSAVSFSTVSRCRNQIKVGDKRAKIDVNSFVATNAVVIGDVSLANASQIWFGAVVKGEDNSVTIGHDSSIMDNAVVSSVKIGYENLPGSVTIGNNTQIGKGAILTGCNIGNQCSIGDKAIVLDGVEVADGAIIADGSVVSQGTKVGPNEYWCGNPAKCDHKITDHEKDETLFIGEHNDLLRRKYNLEYLPYGTVWQKADSE
ncbi:hypothetical protein WA158_004913 [Blastocystis sp. Blastoise]